MTSRQKKQIQFLDTMERKEIQLGLNSSYTYECKCKNHNVNQVTHCAERAMGFIYDHENCATWINSYMS